MLYPTKFNIYFSIIFIPFWVQHEINFLYLYPKGYNMSSNSLPKLRKEHNLTQIELSEKSGVGLRFVRELEQGKETLRLDKVNQVLNLFGAEVGVVPINKSENL